MPVAGRATGIDIYVFKSIKRPFMIITHHMVIARPKSGVTQAQENHIILGVVEVEGFAPPVDVL